MTPEQLQEISDIDPKTVEAIQIAVNSYFAQFEEGVGLAAEDAGPAAEEAPREQATEAAEAEEGAATLETVEGEAVGAAELEPASPAESAESEAGQSDTIKGAD